MKSRKNSFADQLKQSSILISLSLVWYLFWQNVFKSKTYIPNLYTKYYLVAVLAFITAFAIMSGYNKHPDEFMHFLAAQYYFNHWLPPAIGEPSVVHTYPSEWGVSYLDTWGLDYFLAGKIGYVFKSLIDEYIATRFFNVTLFLILLIIYFRRSNQDATQLIPISVLLITPQIWYIFSYTNNDALPLFLSLLIISEIIYPYSSSNRFLNAKSLSSFWYGGVLFGLLLGILFISKQNYYTFLLFIGMWLIYSAITLEPSVKNFPAIKINQNLLFKYLFILVVALSVFLARFSLDVAINGESSLSAQLFANIGSTSNNNKLFAYREKMAAYPFKPSTATTDLLNTHRSLYLKAKGLKYSELFSKWHWHTISFNSFVGVYKYMYLYAPPRYYNLMSVLLTVFALYTLVNIVLSKERSLIIFMLLAVLIIGLTVFISTYHSWINAFQAQGRYLFPIIGILGLLIYQSRFHLHHWIVNGFIFSLFLMSLYSFLFVAMRQINN